MPENSDCIFCKILKGEIPSSKVLEEEKLLVFMDINPVNKGHILIVPKEHTETVLDIPETTLKEMLAVAKKVGKSMKKAIKADGFNLIINNYRAAGQEVMHAHMHVIPRFENDGLQPWPQKKYDEGEIDKFRESIATFL